MKTLNIIGCGKVGQTLGYLFAQANVFQIQEVFNQSLASSIKAVEFIGSGRPLGSMKEMKRADVYMIATSDSSIAESAEKLAEVHKPRDKSIVFHCSGALPAQVLSVLRDTGALIASVHPVASFAEPKKSIESFAGTYCGIEGDSDACETLSLSFDAIEGKPFNIDSERKTLYHTAAVFASNYLVSLMEVSMQTFMKANIPADTASELALSLAKDSIDNISAIGPAQALTGPIARGDMEIVKRQFQELSEWREDIAELYDHFAKVTKRLSDKKTSGK